MKITDLKMYHIRPRWMFLKIETDAGICGWGEPIMEGRARTVETAVNELRPILIGADPLRIEHLWQQMYRGTFYRGGPILMSAISGVEQALWDIKGKYYNAPVYELLGGAVRDKVRMYGHLKPAGHVADFPIESMLEITDKRLEAGFDVMKYSIIPPIRPIDNMEMVDKVVERFAAIRERVGKSVDIAIDFHGRVSPAMSVRLLQALEPYYPLFVEEPTWPENVDEMVRISRTTTIPIAAGERLFTRWDFKKIFEQGVEDIIQPDLSHAGGILECRKISAMAEAYDVAVAPHCPLGPIALAACLQMDACTPNAYIQEQSLGIHYNQGSDLLDYLLDRESFGYADGCVPVSKKPGLGVELNEEKIIEAAKVGHQWKNPVWRNADGTVAEW